MSDPAAPRYVREQKPATSRLTCHQVIDTQSHPRRIVASSMLFADADTVAALLNANEALHLEVFRRSA